MVYVTIKAPQRYHQITLEELLYGRKRCPTVVGKATDTRTYETEALSGRFLADFHVEPLIWRLEKFNTSTEELRQKDRHSLYRSFCIPKKSGKLRHIDAPNPELMKALRILKDMLEREFSSVAVTGVQSSYYHTSAFAYIGGRCTVDAVKRHQANESRWFAKLDFSNFFGTTTLEHTMHMLSMVFPYSEICKSERGREELRKAVELGFLDGVLPQGTPLSPTLTNIIMIPIDFRLFNTLRNYENQRYVYTRYADDMLISSRYTFNVKKIEKLVLDVLKEFSAPYILNKEKTRYGSSSGSNWNLGVMLNKDNRITIGHKKKRQFEAMLSSYAMDRKNGIGWTYDDIAHMDGLRSYYKSIEGETIDKIIRHLSERFGFNIQNAIREDLRGNI